MVQATYLHTSGTYMIREKKQLSFHILFDGSINSPQVIRRYIWVSRTLAARGLEELFFQLCCCVSFFVLVGNRFWCYILTYLGRFCHKKKLVRFEVRFIVHQIVHQIVRTPPRKIQFSEFFFAKFEVQFWGTISRTSWVHPLPRTAARSCQPPARVRCLPPCLVVSSAAQSACVVSSAPLLSSCRPLPDHLAVVSPLPPWLVSSTPPPLIVCPPPTFFSIWLLCVGSAETGRGCRSNVLRFPPLPFHRVISCLLALRLVVPPLACLIFWLLCVGW